MIARNLAALAAGALFGIGLAISGMTDPRVVQGFLDITGTFDLRLAAVLAGAVAVTGLAFRFVLKLPQPVFDVKFHLPTRQDVDRPLVVGAALFGIGWGLAGYCPGPALVGLAGGNPETWLLVPAMLAGGALQRWLQSS